MSQFFLFSKVLNASLVVLPLYSSLSFSSSFSISFLLSISLSFLFFVFAFCPFPLPSFFPPPRLLPSPSRPVCCYDPLFLYLPFSLLPTLLPFTLYLIPLYTQPVHLFFSSTLSSFSSLTSPFKDVDCRRWLFHFTLLSLSPFFFSFSPVDISLFFLSSSEHSAGRARWKNGSCQPPLLIDVVVASSTNSDPREIARNNNDQFTALSVVETMCSPQRWRRRGRGCEKVLTTSAQ